MIPLLLILIVTACLLQPNNPRLVVAGVFALVNATHEIFLAEIDGLAYYGSASIFDLIIIILIGRVNPVTNMAMALQRVCIASILINFTGWVSWVNYFPPTFYNSSYVLLYAWALAVLLKRDDDDVGYLAMGGRSSYFHNNINAWANGRFPDRDKIS